MSGEDRLSLVFVVVISAAVIGLAPWSKRGRSPEQARALADRVRRRRFPYALLGAGGLMAIVGVGMALHARLADARAADLAELEAGAELDASFVEVEGIAEPGRRFCIRGRHGESCYTPLLARPDSERVAAFLAGDAPAGPGRWSGFVSRANALSFRRSAEASGLELADDVFRILPESRRERMTAGSWVSLGGLGLFVAGWVWRRRIAAAVP